MFDSKLREGGKYLTAVKKELKDSSGACGKDTQDTAFDSAPRHTYIPHHSTHISTDDLSNNTYDK